MKHLYIILTTVLLISFLPGCVGDPQMPDDIRNAKAPEVSTGKPEAASATSVTISAAVTKQNGAPTTIEGFCWGEESPVTFQNMTDSLHVPVQLANFSAEITGLSNSKTYYIAAFAGNVAGVTIGETKSFSTISGLGTIETLPPDRVLASSALAGGKITNKGEGTILRRGVYYWKEGSTTKDSVESVVLRDSFTCELTGLSPTTKYYVQAYAYNAFGLFTGGTQKTFSTTAGVPVIASFTKVAVGYTSATFAATVASEGDSSVTKRGFCYGLTTDPKITNDTILCGSGSGAFTGEITKLLSHTQYYVRAYAINPYGVTYSNETLDVITLNELPTVNTSGATVGSVLGTISVSGDVLASGKSAITAAGVCWSTTSTIPTIENDHQSFATTVGEFTGVINQAKGGQTYYVRAYATNSAGTSYGVVKTVVTPGIFVNTTTFSGGNRVPGSVGYFVLEDNLCLLGGDTGPNYTSALYLYNNSVGWQQMNSYPHECAWLSAVGYERAVFVLGGRNNTNELTNDFYSYSIVNNQWTKLAYSPAPTAVARASGARINVAVYFVGGIKNTGSPAVESATNEVWSFDPYGNTWNRKSDFPESQYGGITFSIGDVLYSGFGITNSSTSPVYTKRLMRSADYASSWEEETTLPANHAQAGVLHRGSLYVVDDSGYIWNYNLTSKEWTKKMQLNTVNRVVHCMYSLGDLIYIGLGTNNTLISYSPAWDN